MPNLAELIRGLSPGALQLLKRQLAALPEEDRQRTFSRLSGIPELSDIIGRPTPMREIEAAPKQWEPPEEEETPLWQRGLNLFAAPFRFAQEKVIDPALALAFAPVTPTTPETAKLPWWQRHQAEYQMWQDPRAKLGFNLPQFMGGEEASIGVKDIAGFLPWLAMPSVGRIAGALGKLGTAGKIAEKAVKLTPWYGAEKGLGMAMGFAGKGIQKGVGKLRKGAELVPEQTGIKLQERFVEGKRQVLDPETMTWVDMPLAKAAKVTPTAKAGVPPIKPPIEPPPAPPGAEPPVPPVSPTGAPSPGLSNWWALASSKKAIEARAETELSRKIVAARRAEEINKRVAQLTQEGKLDADSYQQVWRELGSYAYPAVPVGAIIPKELLDEGVRRINSALRAEKVSAFEIKSTVTAFENATGWGKKLYPVPIPRTPGTKGGSAYTRLERVFGKEFTEILSKPEELRKYVSMPTPEKLSIATAAFIKDAAKIPKGQEEVFGQVLREPGSPMLVTEGSLFDPIHLKEGTGVFHPPTMKADRRTPYQRQQDYEAMLLAQTPTAKGVPGGFTDYPMEGVVKQLSMLPTEQRQRVAEVMQASRINLVDLANMPRVPLSMGDLSHMFRQGMILATRHPTAIFGWLKTSLKAMFNPKEAKQWEDLIFGDPDIQRYFRPDVQHTPFLAPLPERLVPLIKMEESFMSNAFYRIPVLGQIAKASARSFATGLNLARYTSLKEGAKVARLMESKGIPVDGRFYSEWAKLTNYATGRGDLELLGYDFNRLGPALNAILFSPRLFFSRFQWPTMIASPIREVRVEAWKQIGSLVGSVGTLLALFKISGLGTVELDPRSPDLGKMKLKDTETRLDLWTGYAQYMRVLAQVAAAQRKSESGYIYGVDRTEILGRFAQSKFSPAFGLAMDIIKGQTFLGEETIPKETGKLLEQAYQRVAPLAWQDMIDGFVHSGVIGGIATSMGMVGVGVTTYINELKIERDRVAQEKYGVSWDEVGRRYGRAEQLKLEQTPSILEAEQEQERRFATGKPTTMRQFQAEGKATEEGYRKKVGLAVKRFQDTNDGVTFREDVEKAQNTRREMYSSRAERKEYQDIVAYYNQPLTPDQTAKMNPGDVLRREYYQQMFSKDMYDQYGKYLFDEAERKEQEFVNRYGQQAMNYIEAYSGATWVDKPVEVKMLEQAKDILRPYWQIADAVWAKYPTELREIANQIEILGRTEPERARQTLRRYPSILRARELIALYRKRMRETNPVIQQARRLFYG